MGVEDSPSGKKRRRATKTDTGIRREQLAQVALEVVGREGLKGLSVVAVAGRVGLVPSGVYKHFRDKEDLLDAAVDLIGGRLLATIGGVCAETDDAVECLHRLLLRHAELIRTNRGIPRIVFSDDVFLGRPDRKAKVFGFVTRYLGAVADLVRRGQRAGRIRSELDPDTVSVLFLGLIQPAAVLWHLSDGTFDAAAHLEQGWAVFVSALLAPPGGAPADL